MVPAAVTGDPRPLQQSCVGEEKIGYVHQAALNAAFQEPSQSSPMTAAQDESTSLSDLALAFSRLLFDMMNAVSEWLAKPSREWKQHESHLQCKAFGHTSMPNWR